MTNRIITISQNVDVTVEVDLDTIDLQDLKANVLRRMVEGKIDPIPTELTQSVGQYTINTAMIERAYYAMRTYTPDPIRELICLLKGRIA